MKKKFFSLVLSFLMIAAILPAGSLVASADTNYYESEDNGTTNSADTLYLENTMIGSISDSDDVDYYKFTVHQNGYVGLNFSNPYNDNANQAWNVTVYKYTNTLEELYDCNVSAKYTSTPFPKIGVTSGTYYVKVSNGSFWNSDAPFNVQYKIKVNYIATDYWESEINDDYANADTIAFGKKYGANLRNKDDNDYYKFTVSKNGYISLNFSNTIENNKKWNVIVYKFTNTLEELESRNVSAEYSSTYFPKIGVTPGTYYIKVSNGSYWSSDAPIGIEYGITVNFTATNYWESEVNNDYTNADVISFGQKYSGYLRNSEDTDYYKFTVSQSGFIKINFANTIVSDSSSKWSVKLYKITNTLEEIQTETISVTKPLTSLMRIWVTPGTYYIKISNGSYWSSDAPVEIEYGIKVNYFNDLNTLVKENGVWYYVEEGEKINATTLVKYNGTWYYAKNGKVDFNATTLCNYGGVWYYVQNGKASFKANTLCKYGNTWYYVQNGKVNFNDTTLFKYGNTWYYVQNGKVNFNATTLCKYGGAWYYVKNGIADLKSTTLCNYSGTWYYVQNGKVNFNATTLCKYGNTWYYVEKGKVNFKATTLCKYGNTWYYVQNGRVNFNANLRFKYYGKYYNVRNGVVKF